jgi:hypothetical protein
MCSRNCYGLIERLTYSSVPIAHLYTWSHKGHRLAIVALNPDNESVGNQFAGKYLKETIELLATKKNWNVGEYRLLLAEGEKHFWEVDWSPLGSTQVYEPKFLNRDPKLVKKILLDFGDNLISIPQPRID